MGVDLLSGPRKSVTCSALSSAGASRAASSFEELSLLSSLILLGWLLGVTDASESELDVLMKLGALSESPSSIAFKLVCSVGYFEGG